MNCHWLRKIFFLFIFFNGFVFIEPAPADLLAIILIGFFLYNYSEKIDYGVAELGFVLISASLVSAIFGYFAYGLLNPRFIFIDEYLFLMFIVLSGIIDNFRIGIDEIIIPWTLASIINIVAYFLAQIKGSTSLYGIEIIKFGYRLNGFFKDPNVCGPFIVVPALYYFNKLLNRITVRHLGLFIFLSFGVLLSMSRAAWLNYLAVGFFIVLWSRAPFGKKAAIVGSILGIAVIIILFILENTALNNLATLVVYRFRLQSYDSERFESQRNAFRMLITSPVFGVGTGNYQNFSNIEAHQTFLRLLGEKGLLGLISAMVFVFPLLQALKRQQKFLAAILVGIYINSFFVDTLHWRFVWVLFALAMNGKPMKKESEIRSQFNSGAVI